MLLRKLPFIIFLFIIVIASHSHAKSIEVYFSFREAFGTVLPDNSGNSNNARIKGNPMVVAGKLGKAMQFDGVDDALRLSHKDDYYLGKDNSYSLLFWINYPPRGIQQIVIEKPGDVSPFRIEIQPDNKISFSISDGTNSPKAIIDNVSGDWHHCCLVRDVSNDRIYMYLDGNLSAEVEDTTESEINNKTEIYIGFGEGIYFQGMLDEFAMYDRALTKDEVKKAAKGTIPDIYRESSLRRFEIISTIALPFTAIHGYLVVRGIEMARKGKVAPKFGESDWLLAGGLALTFSGLVGLWDYLHTHNDDILELPNLSEPQESYSVIGVQNFQRSTDGVALASLSMKF